MSDIRKRTERIWAEITAERTWSPKPDSWHYRVYRWWARRSVKARFREDVCHYLRVVLIWAPLRWLIKPLLGLLTLAIPTGIIWGVLTDNSIMVGALCVPYLIYGALVGQQLLYDLVDTRKITIDPVTWLHNKPVTVRALAILSALPAVILSSVVILAFGTVIVILVGLHDDYDAYRRFWRWLNRVHFGNSKWTSWIRPWLIILVSMITLSFFFKEAGTLLLLVLVTAFGLTLLALTLFCIDKMKRRRAQRYEEAYRRSNKPAVDQIAQVMFGVIHPKWADSPTRFNAWWERYVRFCRKTRGNEYGMDILDHVWHLRYTQQKEVWDRLTKMDPEGTYLSRPLNTPLVHAAKTKKWKICPWVELPAENRWI